MKAGRTSGFFEPAALRRCFGMFIGGLLLLMLPAPIADGIWAALVVGTFIMTRSTTLYLPSPLLRLHLMQCLLTYDMYVLLCMLLSVNNREMTSYLFSLSLPFLHCSAWARKACAWATSYFKKEEVDRIPTWLSRLRDDDQSARLYLLRSTTTLHI